MSAIPLSLLLVEDDPAQQRITAEYLKLLPSFCVEVAVTETLEQTIAEIKQRPNKYDLILLDLGLPDSDGIATIEAVQAVTDIKLLILTGSIMDQKVLDKHEIKGYLNKTQLNLESLDVEIQITIETGNFRKRNKRLEKITGTLKKQIRRLEEE